MGGPGSGVNRGSANGAIIQAIDEARWRVIAARDHLKDTSARFNSAYHSMRAALVEIEEANNDLTCLQRSLGDTELTDRERQRVDEMTSTHPTRLSMLQDAIVATTKANGNAHLAPLKATVRKATA